MQCLDKDDPKNYAKSRLRNDCDDGDKLVHSNREGFRVLEQLTDLQREMKSLEEKNKRKFEILEKEVTRLRLDVEGR